MHSNHRTIRSNSQIIVRSDQNIQSNRNAVPIISKQVTVCSLNSTWTDLYFLVRLWKIPIGMCFWNPGSYLWGQRIKSGGDSRLSRVERYTFTKNITKRTARAQSVVSVVSGRQTRCTCKGLCLDNRCSCRKTKQKCNVYCHKTSFNCQNT